LNECPLGSAALAGTGFPIDRDMTAEALGFARPMANSLDALCRRFKIDNSNRTLHGALLDSDLLAVVYLELLGGRQHGLSLDPNARGDDEDGVERVLGPKENRLEPRPHVISDTELAAHQAYIESKVIDAVWLKTKEA